MKRISQKDLRGMIPPMPEDFANITLSAVPRGEDRPLVKRKVSAAMALAAALLLLTVGGLAAAMNWNALRFLYGQEEPRLAGLTSAVNQKGEAGGVSLEITSAVTDGRALAFDWTLQADESVLPVYLQVDGVHVNEREFFMDTFAGLNRVWIGPEETIMHNGELLKLAEPVEAGGSIHVELTVGVYRPKRDVVLFSSPQDQENARALTEQGVWAVAPVNELPSLRQGEGMYPLWRYSMLSEKEKADYDRSEIKLSFEVPVYNSEIQYLAPDKEIYEMPGATFRIMEAYRTPLSLFARIDMVIEGVSDYADAAQKANHYIFSFSDAQGEHIQGRSFTGDVDWVWSWYYWEDDVLHLVREEWWEAYDNGVAANDSSICLKYLHGSEWKNGALMLDRIGEVRLTAEE